MKVKEKTTWRTTDNSSLNIEVDFQRQEQKWYGERQENHHGKVKKARRLNKKISPCGVADVLREKQWTDVTKILQESKVVNMEEAIRVHVNAEGEFRVATETLQYIKIPHHTYAI